MKLSIIIPAYNIADYLIRCVDSCQKQIRDLSNMEVIIIDDGSVDNTPEIVKRLKEKYKNIKYVKQDNQGQAAARNKGLEKAKGDYIWFVDGDDYLTDEGVDELLEIAIANNLDLIAFNLQFVDEHGAISPYVIPAKSNSDNVYDNNQFVDTITMPHSPCIALFSRVFLYKHGLRFVPNLYFEDFEFTVRAYSLVERARFVNEPHYNYFQRNGSTMKSTSKEKDLKRSRDLIKIADSLYSFSSSQKFGDNVWQWIAKNISFAVLQSIAYYSDESYTLGEIKNKPYFPLYIDKHVNSMEYCKERLFNFSPKLYSIVYKFMR